jgi:hypothetical protein
VVFKKGQITIFIIIGIILLISIGIFIYLYQSAAITPLEDIVVPSVAKAPSEVRPIYDFVSVCVESVGKDALKKVGDYGGYIDSSKFLYNPFIPTDGDAVQFSPDSDLIIPYWWYLQSPNDCTGECVFASLRPELQRQRGQVSIEGQIDEYVNKNLKICLAGLKIFEEQGFDVQEIGEIETETTIAKDAVYILVKYPLRINRADKSFTINEYLAELDVNFGRIYELASELASLEAENSMLERFTIEMISHFSALDKDMLPPPKDFDVKFGQGVIWYKSRTAERLQEILTSYVPLFQIGNTKMYTPIIAPEKTVDGEPVRDKELYENLYNRGMIVPLEKDYGDLTANFVYLPWWNPYLDLNCDGEVCMPQSVSTMLLYLQIGLHKYDFAYDVSYPVLVEIKDPFAFNSEGYSFKFFLETNLRNNLPMPAEFKPERNYLVSANTMLCDATQRTSGNVTIFVKDKKTNQGIDNAVVGYTCGRESCTLGNTAGGTLITTLPRCIGGLLSANKQEYQSKFEPLDVVNNQSMNVEVALEPYRYMNFAVKKYLLSKGAAAWSLDTDKNVNQAQDEDTIILLRRAAGRFDSQFSAFGEVCGMPGAKSAAACGSPPEDNSEDVALIPGLYSVKIYSAKYAQPEIEIPRDLRSAGSGLTRQEFYLPEEPIVFDQANPFPAGFAEFEWNITAEQLDSGDTIEFYYISVALDKVPKSRRKIEDLSEMGKALAYSRLHKSLLEPKIFNKARDGASTITVKI